MLFFIFNYSVFSGAGPAAIFYAFAYGLRFDLSTVLSVNALLILLSLLPMSFTETKGYGKLLTGIFIVGNAPFLWMNLADISFFPFTGRRTSSEIFKLASDVGAQTGQLLIHYWYIAILCAFFFAVLFFFSGKTAKKNLAPGLKGWLLLLLASALTVGGIRGSMQQKPLLPGHAFTVQPAVLGNLVLNTPFVVFKTMGAVSLPKYSFFPNQKALRNVLQAPETQFSGPIPAGKPNVVVIILESFASEYVGYGNPHGGFTPFLDSLLGVSLTFKNGYANGRRSVEALPAVLASVPTLSEDGFITGPFSGNEIHGLGEALAAKGYRTAFFHGGKNGTMGFDYFSGQAGFAEYYGLNQYPEPGDYDGNWGIPDEPFLQFTARTLNQMPQPFAAGIFTLSSHQPYTIPDAYKGKFPKGRLPVHESIGYADYALRRFFAVAKTMPWFKNTLFVLTADHTQMHEYPEYDNTAAWYRVPIAFYCPAGNLPAADTGRVAQHLDIYPSVLDYLHIKPAKRLAFGQSVFNKEEGYALNYPNNDYTVTGRTQYLTFRPTSPARLFRIADGKEVTVLTPSEADIKKRYLQKAEAAAQYYNNGLTDNTWYK